MRKISVLLSFLIVFLLIPVDKCSASYTNQIGKYSTYNNALKVKQRLEKEGYEVYITKKSPFYAGVGRYENREDAEVMQKELQQKNYTAFVQNFEKYHFADILPKTSVPVLADNLKYQSFNNYPLIDDSVLTGTFSSQSLFFYLNENWEPNNNSYVDINFSHSDVSTTYNSTLTVLLNNHPIKSIKLTNEEKDNRNLRINFPKQYINSGYNTVTFRLYKRMSDLPCEDIFNPANWFKIQKNSFFHVEYEEKIDNLNLNQYPYPYFKEGRKDPIDTVLVLPEKYNSKHLTAAANLALGFGREEQFKNIKIRTQKGLENDYDLKNANPIIIGEDKEFLNLPEMLKRERGNNDILQEVISPWNENKKVLRLNASNESLAFISKVLFNKELVKQMNWSEQILEKENLIFPSNEIAKENVTLEKLGYEDVVLSGVYKQKTAFNYELPEGWQLQKGAKINLNYRFSEALEFKESAITVNVNGIPIGSKKLLKENANGDQVSFMIPDELYNTESFNVEVVFYFDLRDIDCTKRYDDQAWAVINKDSSFYFPHKNEKGQLETYPSFLFSGGELDDFAIVLADNANLKDVETALNIFSYLGHQTQDIGEVKLIYSSELDNKYKDYNLILLGLPTENKKIAEIMPDLWVKYSKEENRFVPNEDFGFLPKLSSKSGIVELIPSPWNKEKKVIVATAENRNLLVNTSMMLNNLELTSKMRGVVSFFNDSGEMFNYEKSGNEEKIVKDNANVLKKFHEKIGLRNLIVYSCLLIFVLVVLIITIRTYKNKK